MARENKEEKLKLQTRTSDKSVSAEVCEKEEKLLRLHELDKVMPHQEID